MRSARSRAKTVLAIGLFSTLGQASSVKLLIPVLVLALAVCSSPGAEEKAAVSPLPHIGTFFIHNVSCTRCVDSIAESVQAVPGVEQVRMSYQNNYALVWFDPAVASHHQVAQAIADAVPVKGENYEAYLKFRVPDYPTGTNSARVEAVFKKFARWATISPGDATRGDFQLKFLPLKKSEDVKGPLGLRIEELQRAIQSPPPAGLGLKFELIDATGPKPH